MIEEKNTIPQVIKNEIISNFSSIVRDYSEIALDEFIESDAINKLPIVGTVYSLYKFGSAVANAFFAKKLLIFLMQLKNNAMDENTKNILILKINSDEKILEQTIIFLNRFDMEWKSKILANLLQQFVIGNFNWTEYCTVSQIIDSFTFSLLLITI